MTAKRRLDFSTPARKRVKGSTVVYRNMKSEMKFLDTNIPYSGLTSTSQCINLVGNAHTQSGRVGSKIKIWRIQAVIAETSSSNPIRIDFTLPKNATVAPTVTYGGLIDQDTCTTLYQKFLHNGTSFAATGSLINFKLPLGIVAYYDGTAGTSLVRNAIFMHVNTPALETITINARIWYTDA